MIPYIDQPSLDLGPLTIHAFGVLVAAGVLLGIEIFKQRITQVGLDSDLASRMLGWLLVVGFLGAHLVDRLFYNFHETLDRPVTLLIFWEGISSFGGLFGGALGAWIFLRRNTRGVDAWRYLDSLAYALPLGWFLGRMGCFVAFDHVGVPTDHVLGQVYADGIVRHNLGFEEALYSLVIASVIFILGSKPRPPGFLVGVLAVLYAPARFLLDFLRIADERYAGLIVSQYASLLLLGIGVWLLGRSYRMQARRARARSGQNAVLRAKGKPKETKRRERAKK